jgi:predicted nuclease of restriction endonuclease-like RecB superfamily
MRFSIKNDVIKPLFVEEKIPSVKTACEQLLALYSEQKDISKKELSQNSAAIINSQRSSKMVKGLNKILLVSCEFEKSECCDYISLREKLFENSAKFYFLPQENSFDEISRNFREDFLKNIYGDHPDCEKLLFCKIKTVRNLIDEYIISIVQVLLLSA